MARGVKHGIIGDKQLQQNPLPLISDPRWTLAGKLSNIYIYPVKSLHGISMKSALVQKHGISHGLNIDRQFIIIDGKKQMVTGSRFPKLVLIRAQVLPNEVLLLQAPGMEDFQLKIQKNGVELIQTDVIGAKCQGLDQGPEIGIWIGKYLAKEHMEFKLLYHDYQDKSSSRQLQPKADPIRPMTKETDVPLFANFYGLMMVNEDSIHGVNESLAPIQMEVEHSRFRPNLVVKGIGNQFCSKDKKETPLK